MRIYHTFAAICKKFLRRFFQISYPGSSHVLLCSKTEYWEGGSPDLDFTGCSHSIIVPCLTYPVFHLHTSTTMTGLAIWLLSYQCNRSVWALRNEISANSFGFGKDFALQDRIGKSDACHAHRILPQSPGECLSHTKSRYMICPTLFLFPCPMHLSPPNPLLHVHHSSLPFRPALAFS